MNVLDLRSLADGRDAKALTNRMRTRRFKRFEGLIESLPRPIRIIDIGGTNEFWEQRGWAGLKDVEITAVNFAALELEQRHQNIRVVAGDAADLPQFRDQEFDVAFSNSVIEHLFTKERQMSMANEIRRIAKAYWVQTPNYWFPIEPHFHTPGWQWLPHSVRVSIIRRRRCGWRGPCPDVQQAEAAVSEVRLMTRSELAEAFPGALIWKERFLGLTKSLVAYDGFDTNRAAT